MVLKDKIKNLSDDLKSKEKDLSDALKDDNASEDVIKAKTEEVKNLRASITEHEGFLKEINQANVTKPATVEPAQVEGKEKAISTYFSAPKNMETEVPYIRAFRNVTDTGDPTPLTSVASTDVFWFDRAKNLMSIPQFFSTDSQTVRLINEGTPAGIAGFVAEGAAGNEITSTTSTVTQDLKAISAFIKVTDEQMRNAETNYFNSYIVTRARDLIEKAMEDGLFMGSGTGNNPRGFFRNQSNGNAKAPDFTIAANATNKTNSLINHVLDASVEIRSTGNDGCGERATHIAMNPMKHAQILKSVDGNDRHLFDMSYSAPVQEGNPTLWGLPVVQSEAIPMNDVYVCASSMMQVWSYNGGALFSQTGQEGDDLLKRLQTTVWFTYVTAFLRHANGVKLIRQAV